MPQWPKPLHLYLAETAQAQDHLHACTLMTVVAAVVLATFFRTTPLCAASYAALRINAPLRPTATRRNLRTGRATSSSVPLGAAMDFEPTAMETDTATDSTASKDAMGAPPAASGSTGAHSAGTGAGITVPRTVPSSDFLPVVTPLLPDAWEQHLRAAGLI